MTHDYVRRFVHHHLRVHGHRELHRLARAADAVVRVGRGYRKLGLLRAVGRIVQHCCSDIARVGLIQTCHHCRIVAAPAIGHPIAEGGAEDHLSTFGTMTELLVRRCGHHDLRVHCNGKRCGLCRRTGDAPVQVGRGDGEVGHNG